MEKSNCQYILGTIVNFTGIKKYDEKYKAMIVAIQSELWSTVLYTVPDEHMSEGVRGTGDIVKQMM